MKALKNEIAKVLIKVANKGLKNDLESTGSGWAFQPKIPVKKDQIKKQK